MQIHQLAPFNLPGTGMVNLTVIGSNFGAQDYTPNLLVMRPNGLVSCPFTHWASESCLICRAPAGFGKDLQIIVQISNQELTSEGILSFDVPSIFSIEPACSPTFGLQEVWIRGKNFGKLNTKEIYCKSDEKNVTVCQTLGYVSSLVPRIFIGISECTGARWFSDDLVYCKTVEGTGHSLIVKVDVGNQTGYLSSAFTYHAPVVLNSTRVVSSHQEVELIGSSFGFFSSTPKASIGLTPCEFTFYFSDSSLTCKVSSGVGQDLTIAVTVGSSLQSNISCYLASLSSGNIDAQSLTDLMTGGHADFCKHLSQLSAYGKYARYERALFTYGGTLNSSELNVSAGSTAASQQNIGPDEHRILLSLPGSKYGSFDSSASVRVGLTAASATHWISDSMIWVKPSFGLSDNLDLQLTIAHQRATFFSAFSYDFVSIQDSLTLLSLLDPQSHNDLYAHVVPGINSPALGNVYGAIILISGGIVDSSPRASLGTVAHSTAWISDTFILVKVAEGSGSGVDLAITIQGISRGGGSACQVFSYDLPSAQFVSYAHDVFTAPSLPKMIPNFPCEGGNPFLIFGSNLGAHATGMKSNLHKTASEYTRWRSDVVIYGKVPAGLNPMLFSQVRITSDLQISTTSELFSYDSPAFSLNSPSNIPTLGSMLNISRAGGISISASNLGTSLYSLGLRVDGTSASHTLWTSDTRYIPSCIG